VLLALEEVDGDLSDNQAAFQEALANVEFQNPMGANVRLDDNRQAISDIFLTRVVNDGGTMRTEAFGTTEGVTQTMGMDEEEFLALGSPSRDNPDCPPGLVIEARRSDSDIPSRPGEGRGSGSRSIQRTRS
jgi:branched-chain amino acid transport system substrate-binding protein